MSEFVSDYVLLSAIEIATSATVGIITAIFSVGLTFWLHRIRAEIRTLRALKNEIEQNEGRGFDLLIFVADDIVKLTDDSETAFTPSDLNTSAYEDAHRNGLVQRFSEKTKSTLNRHYTEVERTNQYLQNRLNLMGGSQSLSAYSGIAAVTDRQIIDQVFRLYYTHPDDELDEEMRQSIDPEPLTDFLDGIGVSVEREDIEVQMEEDIYYEDSINLLEDELDDKFFTWLF